MGVPNNLLSLLQSSGNSGQKPSCSSLAAVRWTLYWLQWRARQPGAVGVRPHRRCLTASGSGTQARCPALARL